jgi:hypothetical protein
VWCVQRQVKAKNDGKSEEKRKDVKRKTKRLKKISPLNPL